MIHKYVVFYYNNGEITIRTYGDLYMAMVFASNNRGQVFNKWGDICWQC